MTKKPRGRPIRISQGLIFPRRARFLTIRAVPIQTGRRSRRIDPISLPILSLELAPPILSLEIALQILSLKIDLLPSLPIVQQIQPEASRKIVAAQVAAIAP
jgi:hypothetical protein